jgi:hypothetical protein
MKTVLIIVEAEVLEKPLYFGKSGDFAIIDYFLRNNWNVFLLNANNLQKEIIKEIEVSEVQNEDYSTTFYESITLECCNIRNGKTPSTGADGLKVNLKVKKTNLSKVKDFLLLSRAMPQSITREFLRNFSNLGQNAFHVPQNMNEIYLYKDKVIPYLLQKNNDNLEMLYSTYSSETKKFVKQNGNIFESLSLNTFIIDLANSFEENYEKIIKINGKFCIKPFNLFGGIGVKIFQDSQNKKEILQHIETIKKEFIKYKVSERYFALVQEAVIFPEFGDVRVLFSYGKFIGAFIKCEPQGYIHNTMYGGIIIPVCNENFIFHQNFEQKYREPFLQTVHSLTSLNEMSSFLRNEFVCGYDLLLTEENKKLQFKLTETNIACPTGFPFLDSSLIVSLCKEEPSIEYIKAYFKNNARAIDIVMNSLVRQATV